MAMITRAQRVGENAIHHPATKGLFKPETAKPRAALGTISTNVTERNVPAKQKPQVVKEQHEPVVEKPLPPSPVKVTTIESPERTMELSAVQVVEDIDAFDIENPQLCCEYVKDIYKYMEKLEATFHVKPVYLSEQPQVNAKMRCILVDWLVQVHLRFTLLQETLYLTISIIDRYLQNNHIEKSKLQLVGVTAMLVASKYEEMYAPEVRDFVYITDNTYTSQEIREMEQNMLRSLDYSLGTPLCLHFLRRYSRAGDATPEIHTMAKFLTELCLQEYNMLQFTPSKQAASALYLAMKLADSSSQWTTTLQHYSNYSEEDILPCVHKMAQLVVAMNTSKQQAVKNKYSSTKFMKIAKEPSLSSKTVLDLAAAAAE